MNTFTLPRLLLLLILMLSVVLPTALQGLKIVLLALVMGGLLLCALRKPAQMRWSTPIFFWAILFSTMGFLWSFYGVSRGNPGATRVLTVMAIYPLLFTLLGYLWKPGDAARLQKAFLWFGFILVFSQALYIGSSAGLDGGFFYRGIQSLYGDVAVVDQGDNYFLFTLPSVASLIFFLPFYFVGFLFDSKFNIKYIILLLSAVVIVLLTGRRAIYLSFAMSILLISGIITVGYLFFPRRVPRLPSGRLTFVCLGLTLFIVLLLSVGLQNQEMLLSSLQSIFDFQSNESNLERKYQYEALKEAIGENVIFGAGAGAAASYSRSFEQPWAYELFYVSLIFHYGILGFVIYVSGFLFLVWGQLKCIFAQELDHQSRLFALCFLAGFFSFIIATATNPYIGKFDYMWVVFIPVLMINSFRLTNEV
jgi:O-antigen ligase/polysaccharide polymerase Wzy-like membrane protein